VAWLRERVGTWSLSFLATILSHNAVKNLIIGGGPAGSYLALLLARKGESVELYEKNPRQDKNPKPCSGGAARWWLMRTGVPISNEFIGDTIKTVRILYGKETIWEATPGSEAGLILTRGKFERFLQKEAEDEGAKVHYEARFNGFQDYDRVFLAEGAVGRIKRSLGFEEKRQADDFHLGVQVIGRGPVEEHTIEVYADDILQGGYLWRFPHELGVEVGLGIPASRSKEAWPILNKWIEKMGWKIEPVIKQTHIIPTNYPQRQRFGKVMLLGDNAYLTSPISGGGIHAALYSAKRASEGKAVGRRFVLQSRIMYMARNRIINLPPSKVAELISGLDVTYRGNESPYSKLIFVIKAMRGALGLVI
jgi:flavin-dependent dehydrogenase